MDIGRIISHLGKIGSDVAAVQTAVSDVGVKVAAIKTDPKVMSFLAANPDVKAEIDAVSADIRTIQNAVSDLKNITK